MVEGPIQMERNMLNTQGQKDQHLGQGEDKRHRYNQRCEKNEVVLGRSHQPPQRRSIDLACNHVETIY